MKNRKFAIYALLIILTIIAFKNYYLEPKSELIRESIQASHASLQKYEQFIKGGQITEGEMKIILEEMKNIEARLLKEKSEFLASAKFQAEISDISEKAGLRITIMRPSNMEKLDNFMQLPIYFEGNGNIKQISDFLKYLESGKYIIKIDKLNINIINIQNPRELKFKIQVSGLSRV